MEIIRHMSNEELADLSIDSDRRALRENLRRPSRLGPGSD